MSYAQKFRLLDVADGILIVCRIMCYEDGWHREKVEFITIYNIYIVYTSEKVYYGP